MGNGMDGETRYYLIACGTKDYNAFPELPSVEADLELVNSLFTSNFGYERVLPSLHLNPTTNDLKQKFPDWLRDGERDGTENILIFYYSGHGEYCQGDRHYLVLEDTNSDDIASTALPTEDLVRPLNNKKIKISQILYILDTCFAQNGVGDIIKFVTNALQNYQPVRGNNIEIHAIAACRAKDTATEGVLTKALKQALDNIELIDLVSGGYVELGRLVDKMNREIVDSNQRVKYNLAGIETYAKFLPFSPKTWREWYGKCIELVEDLFRILQQDFANSLFLINSFLWVYKNLNIRKFIVNEQEFIKEIKILSETQVYEEKCPLILFSEWCRLKLIEQNKQDLAEQIDTWKGKAIRYRDGVQLDTTKECAKELQAKFKRLIEGQGRLQIVISPIIDDRGLKTKYFHVNILFVAQMEHEIEFWINPREEEISTLKIQNTLSEIIPETLYYLLNRAELEIEFFVPFALLPFALQEYPLDDIKFRCDDISRSLGSVFPVFVNSFDRYFDEDFREIRDEIEDIKKALWENGDDLDGKYYIGTEPLIADLEEIVESLPIAVWSRNSEPIGSGDLNVSEWKNWPNKIQNLRRNNRKIALFWDDLYPKPSRRTRPLNTRVVESHAR
jgi:hypothetical protein